MESFEVHESVTDQSGLPRPVRRRRRVPSIKTMERWISNGVAKATDGCSVEPDGRCPHGKPSWLLRLGLI